MVDKKRLRGPQFRAVEALEKLGSSLEHAQQGMGGYVLMSKPFHQDRTPSVEVFIDGGYRDFADATDGWAEIGLKSFGTYLDLEESAEGRFQKVWNELSPLSSEGREYLEGRKISTEGLKSDGPAVCFPLWHGDKMVGIQRRFTDGRTPKNRCFAGSDASGLFYPPDFAGSYPNVLFVCEGATDSYTMAHYGSVAGVMSASTLEGLREVIPFENRKIVLCFDADKAGREAERKVFAMFPDQQLNCLNLCGWKDANELVCAFANLPVVLEFLPIVRDSTSDLEFIEGSLASAPDGLWLGWWPPSVPKGAPTSFTPKDGYSWYVFPHDIDPLKAREWCWSHRVSGYVCKEVSP